MSDENGKEKLVFDAQAETLLGAVNECFLAGQFAEAPEDAVNDGDTVIGEMTGYEKALYTMRRRIADEHNALNAAARKNSAPEESDIFQMGKLSLQHELLNQMMWTWIRLRLGLKTTDGEIGIRQGYQIVHVKSSPSANSIAGILGMLMRAKQAGHAQECDGDCENCEHKGHEEGTDAGAEGLDGIIKVVRL